jgi:hypothetical protein
MTIHINDSNAYFNPVADRDRETPNLELDMTLVCKQLNRRSIRRWLTYCAKLVASDAGAINYPVSWD